MSRRDREYIGRKLLSLELPGRKSRRRPKRRSVDPVNEDMKVAVKGEDAEDRVSWRKMIRRGEPLGETQKEKKIFRT